MKFSSENRDSLRRSAFQADAASHPGTHEYARWGPRFAATVVADSPENLGTKRNASHGLGVDSVRGWRRVAIDKPPALFNIPTVDECV